ncbi:hypothetical protein ACP70R_025785 [Stipagrostis hirtigluma subsp. patula]
MAFSARPSPSCTPRRRPPRPSPRNTWRPSCRATPPTSWGNTGS